ncbi:histidine-containing phosphotransfer protein 2 [Cocos nucifera]|nr:histidine-containing phosphotransfer protein 2 [Cocos nucifera]
MASLGLEKQLHYLIESMYEEGLLDVQFQHLQILQNEENPNFVAEVITTFFANTEKVFKELEKLMKEIEVDYKKMDCYIHQLKGSSASVGAHGVEKASIDMRDFCDQNDIEGYEKNIPIL